MFEKIKSTVYHPYIQHLKDVRIVGLLAFGVIVLLVTWNTVIAIEQNYKLQKQISELNQEVSVQQLKNKNMELGNEYYHTDAFLELAARDQFGLGKPGEKLILVPKQVALAHTVDVSDPSEGAAQNPTSKPWYRQNLEAWWDFFLHRPSVEN